MGRLYWKILLLTLLAQAVAMSGTIATFTLRERSLQGSSTELDVSMPAAMSIDAAASVLQYGGVKAFADYVEHARMPNKVIAVGVDGTDVLGRHFDTAALEQARALVGRFTMRRAVRDVQVDGGAHYLVFVPNDHGFPQPRESDHGAGPDHDFHGPQMVGGPMRGHRFWPIFPLVSGTIASLIFASALAYFLSKPVRRLREAFAAAAHGDLSPKFADLGAKRRDDFATLGREFDAMSARLRALIEEQQRLLHDVSHEMRSPLARMQAAIGLARQDEQQLPTTLDRIDRESVRMDKLVDQILTLSRVQSGIAASHEEDVSIDTLLSDIVDDAMLEARARGCSIQLGADSGAWMRGREELLHRAVENVVRNAIKHTKDGTKVDVTAVKDQQGRVVRIQVCDQGHGIAEDEMAMIFQPFYRGTSATQNGYGLGLTIAKRVVESHHGRISAHNRETGGLCVEIELPLIQVTDQT